MISYTKVAIDEKTLSAVLFVGITLSARLQEGMPDLLPLAMHFLH